MNSDIRDQLGAHQTGPGPRNGHRMTYDAARAIALLFGGQDSDDRSLGDTWGWDGVAWRKLSTGGLEPRSWHTCIYDKDRKAVVLFGGKDLQRVPYGDLWRFEENQWVLKMPKEPPARIDHALAFDQNRGKVVLFGGKTPGPDGWVFGDTWEWDHTGWKRR